MKEKINDHDKLTRLYELYEQKMYVVAYSILNNRWQAEDAVSESFIRIIKNLQKIKAPESDKTKRFIIRIIQTTAIDIYRKNQRESMTFTVISNEDSERFPDSNNSIDEMLKDMGSKEEINRLLAELPDKYREVFAYRCIQELSVKETAAVLEISENLVRKRYERARAILMKKLGDDQYECKII